MENIIDGTIESYYNNRVNHIESNKFNDQSNLTSVSEIDELFIRESNN